MKPSIDIQEKTDYLRFYVEGTNGLQEQIDYFTAVADECRKRGYEKALIVEALEGNMSVADTYEITAKLPALFRGLRFALVDLHPEHVSMNRFGEDVGVNRGCIALHFQNEEDAVHWLSSS